MSWHFSQALVAAFSGANSLGGEQSALSSSTPTPAMFFWPARTTDAFRRSRSGMTCEPLTADRGEALLMWCLEDSRARTSAQPERVLGSAAPVLDSGARWHALLVKFSPDSCGWKTARCLWEEDLDWSCLTLPRWGSLHDGELWERTTQALHINEKESGLWPTPRAGNPGSRPNGKGGKILAKEVAIAEGLRQRGEKRWPTPTVDDSSNVTLESGQFQSLTRAVMMFPTPTVQDSANNGGPSQANRNSLPLNAVVGGALNPTWVEWLMGWPLGWTDCAVSATARFQEWCSSHGRPWQMEIKQNVKGDRT